MVVFDLEDVPGLADDLQPKSDGCVQTIVEYSSNRASSMVMINNRQFDVQTSQGATFCGVDQA